LKAGRVIGLYAVAVVVIGSLLAPWVFLAIQEWGGVLAQYPFRRVYNRVLLVVALVGLWPLLRSLGIRCWSDVGFIAVSKGGRQFAWGLLLGIASLGVAAQLVFLLGGRTVRGCEFDDLLAQCGKFLLTGLVVGLIEETFFRGGVQNVMQRGMPAKWALVVASAIYSLLHFLKPKHIVIPVESISWFTGFDYFGQVLFSSWEADGMWRGFTTLWLAGIVLGSAFVWTRSLYLSIGLHAGWVFMLKMFSWATQRNPDVNAWWTSSSLVDNVVVWPVMGLLWLVLWWRCQKQTF